MSEKEPRNIIPSDSGMFHDFVNWLKLIFHLMADSRVSPLLKLMPLGTIIYLLNPLDIPGPLDDAAVMGLGLYMFVELCPPDVVDEHRERIEKVLNAHARNIENDEDIDIIEGEIHDLD